MDICNNIIIGGGGGLRTEGVSPRKRNSQSSQSTDIDVPHLKAQKANTHLEHWCLLDVFTKPHTLSHTGIICTIGMYKALFQLLTYKNADLITHVKLLYYIQCMNFINCILHFHHNYSHYIQCTCISASKYIYFFMLQRMR